MRWAGWALVLAGWGLIKGASAQSITFIVPFSAGSGPDGVVRALAHEVSVLSGRTAIVDNRPGASSVLAAQAVARARPDGATVLLTGNVAFTGNPHVMKRLPYDPVADFTPVTALTRGPMVLYVNPRKLPVAGVLELLQALQRDPGRYSYGYTSITSRLPAEVLQRAAGLKLVGVPYRSGSAAVPDLIGGRIDLLFTDFSAWPHVLGGRLRAIAVTDAQRSPYAPDLPTFAEAGMAQMEIGFWLAAYLPARAAPEAVGQLQSWLARAMKVAPVQAELRMSGTTEFLLPPRALADHQARESLIWGRIIYAAGIEPE
jgi:tripartite-type tricarboxylate transporter receptor subunit TctC